MTKPRIIWGSINIGYTENWYETCIDSMKQCDALPDIAVVLEIDPVNQDIKNKLQHGPISWFFINHGLAKISNINNDNARNLRYLIPKMTEIARENDIIALIEQDVIIRKPDWISQSIDLLSTYKMVSAAGAYVGNDDITRRNKPKPYFTLFKSHNSDEITEAIKTNRGSFVTINIEDNQIFRLDKHKKLALKSHLFGTDSELWAIHARGGSNHDGIAARSIAFFNHKKFKRLYHRAAAEW